MRFKISECYVFSFAILFLFSISIYGSIIETPTGFAVYEQLDAQCKKYFGDTICDDAQADCGANYKAYSFVKCDECQTVKDGKSGFAKCVGTSAPQQPASPAAKPATTPSSTAQLPASMPPQQPTPAPTTGTGSCQSPSFAKLCGGKGTGNCYCDTTCSKWGDCCTDYASVCGSGGAAAPATQLPKSPSGTSAVQPLTASPTSLVGDFNDDKCVDMNDFSLFADAFGKSDSSQNKKFDLNNDGTIGFPDFFIYSDNFGKGCEEKMQEVLDQINNKDENKNDASCIRLFGNGEKGMDIFIVGTDYASDQIRYNKPYNLKDLTKNLENDAYRFLFSDDKDIGYGLLTIEPFASNLNKINVYLVTESITGIQDFSPLFERSKELINEHCGISFSTDDVIAVINGEADMGGGMSQLGAFHRKSAHNYKYVVSSLIHEIGHAYGLYDVYGNAYWENGAMDDSSSIPNCDNTPGCPKWCKGSPLPKYKTPCSDYNEVQCKAYSDYKDCQWLPSPDPFFGERCIKRDGLKVDDNGMGVGTPNIGTDCLEGAGCYFGCSGAGYRGVASNNFAGVFNQRINSQGEKHTYEPVSERFISDIFACCYPSSCSIYDKDKCKKFSEIYARYSMCNVC